MTKDSNRGESSTERKPAKPREPSPNPATEAGDPASLAPEIDRELARLEAAIETLSQSIDERLDRDRIKILNGTLAQHHLEKELAHRKEVNSKLTFQINEFIKSLTTSSRPEGESLNHTPPNHEPSAIPAPASTLDQD